MKSAIIGTGFLGEQLYRDLLSDTSLDNGLMQKLTEIVTLSVKESFKKM
ncbi:MAG: hypothetical protein WAV31_05110 [Candidatus Moraniibacteriota bacterium]